MYKDLWHDILFIYDFLNKFWGQHLYRLIKSNQMRMMDDQVNYKLWNVSDKHLTKYRVSQKDYRLEVVLRCLEASDQKSSEFRPPFKFDFTY